ncbi:HlyD family secretion protein [Chitinophaga japonensis]|uniref:HlyD family secretion protein n=2 Tax=Chitinophaga japonensis TaxID=104662 RepID=A0A562SM42_CHIJA|nr:HlyD family secretion protein [Chitinophaga japonensis]
MEFTAEHHFQQHHTRSRVIYQAVLLFLMLGFGSLFFIRVDVSVNSRGILRAAAEHNTVKAPVSGRIERVLIRENQLVKPGDTLLEIQAGALEAESAYVVSRQQELSLRIGDLKQLTALSETLAAPGSSASQGKLALNTSLYAQQYSLFKEQLAEPELARLEAQTRFARQKILHDQKVTSDAEFEQDMYALKNAQARLHLVYDKQMSQWQTELNELKRELRELSSRKQQFDQEKEFYTVKAVAGGSIQHFNGIRPGSFVTLGETLAQISPDSGLIAEVQVLPGDIGLLRKGMTARFQVDAFNYNEWGMVEGHIWDIADDVLVTESGSPVFLVKCRLDNYTLRLRNGYEGALKKGMTLQARFMVTRRTLFQLLYDKTDNWLNPGRA